MQKHVLKYFCEMNIDMLELVLDDSKTYQNVSKDLFLKKLDSLFKRFKDRDDISLEAFPGNCSAELCNKGLVISSQAHSIADTFLPSAQIL